jgi:hypothetical protein
VGNFSCKKNNIQNVTQKRSKSSEHLMMKLGILFGPTQFDWLRRRSAGLLLESEIKGKFKKLKKVKRELFGITTEEGELKVEDK